MEPVIQSQVGKEVKQEVECHWGVPGDLNLKLHNLPRPVETCCLRLLPILAVSE